MDNIENNSVVAKIVGMKSGMAMVNLIGGEERLNIHLSFVACANLLANKDEASSIEVRKGYADDNEKKYDPRSAIYAKYLGDDNIRIAIGKNNGAVKKASDLHPAIEYSIKDLGLYLQIALTDMQHEEDYKHQKNLYFNNKRTNSGIVI